MKRSEAIEIIGKWLVLGKPGFDKAKQEEYKDKSLADCILTDLEKAGMLPPTTEIPFKNMIGCTEFVRDNCWEKEDE